MHRTCVLLREIALAVAMAVACGVVHAAGHEDPAAQYRRLQQSSDDGLVRPDGLVNALAQRERMMAARRKSAGMPPATGPRSGPATSADASARSSPIPRIPAGFSRAA